MLTYFCTLRSGARESLAKTPNLADGRSLSVWRYGRACLLSFSRGEFGGWTNVYDPAHEPYHLPDTQALRFVQVGNRLLVIHGLRHGFGTGWITTLKRARDGRWTQSIIADMTPYPIAFAVDGDRLLLLLEKEGDCEKVVVALDPRNRLSIVQ